MSTVSPYNFSSLVPLTGNKGSAITAPAGGNTPNPTPTPAPAASPTSPADTITLTLADGSKQTTTINPNGTISVSITFSAETASQNPLGSVLANSANANTSGSSTQISLPGGGSGEITKNSNGTYTLKFTAPVSTSSTDGPMDTASASQSPSTAISGKQSVNSSSTTSSSTSNTSSTTVTLTDGTLEKITNNPDGTQTLTFSPPEDPTPPVSGQVVNSALAREAAHKKLIEGLI